jgi:SAM-dependent methyltransferase
MARRSDAQTVFDKYAHEYDWITNAAQREPAHAREVEAIIARFGPHTVLDAGCATGLTTKLFAERGVSAVGLDRSKPILKQAKLKFADAGLPLTFRHGLFEKLPKSLHRSFDLVVCLANSISGVGSLANLSKSLRCFRDVLKPGGTLVLQMLNYAAVKEGVAMPIKATENDGIVYARYSIRRGKTLAIHVVRLDLNQSPPANEPFVHEFDNFSPDEMLSVVRTVGLVNSRSYGNLLMTERFRKSARDLVITASRK